MGFLDVSVFEIVRGTRETDRHRDTAHHFIMTPTKVWHNNMEVPNQRLAGVWSLLQSASRESVCELVFTHRQDILNIYYRLCTVCRFNMLIDI